VRRTGRAGARVWAASVLIGSESYQTGRACVTLSALHCSATLIVEAIVIGGLVAVALSTTRARAGRWGWRWRRRRWCRRRWWGIRGCAIFRRANSACGTARAPRAPVTARVAITIACRVRARGSTQRRRRAVWAIRQAGASVRVLKHDNAQPPQRERIDLHHQDGHKTFKWCTLALAWHPWPCSSQPVLVPSRARTRHYRSLPIYAWYTT